MRQPAPSSGAARHLLPQGEKEVSALATNAPINSVLPSPLVGEGARRADEGGDLAMGRKLLGYARSMRHEPTEAERKLWLILRNRRFADSKFRRQVPIGPFIADFVCFSAKLIIEADGSQHAESPQDARRDRELERRGFRLLRLWNNDILARPNDVLEAIWAKLHEKTS